MSRSAQNLKGLFTPRPPRHRLPSPPPPQLQPFLSLSFSFQGLHNKATAFFSLLIRLFSKTLRFLSSSMDSFSFSLSSSYVEDDFFTLDPSPPSPSIEPLFLVHLRWWTHANAAMNGGSGGSGGEIEGVLYNVMSSLSKKKLEKDDSLSEVESEVVLNMRRGGEAETSTSENEGDSGSGDLRLALLSEWMFLKAFKW